MTTYRRPAHKSALYYRDCLPIDDDLLANFATLLDLQFIYELIKMYFTLFNVSIEEVFMPKFDYSLLDNENMG